MIPQFYCNFCVSSALSFTGIIEGITLAILVRKEDQMLIVTVLGWMVELQIISWTCTKPKYLNPQVPSAYITNNSVQGPQIARCSQVVAFVEEEVTLLANVFKLANRLNFLKTLLLLYQIVRVHRGKQKLVHVTCVIFI